MLAAMPSSTPPPTGQRAAAVWDGLREALDRLAAGRADGLTVVDAGGGTGGVAVPIAELGHHVTVVDPSPDSLAALGRRAAERGCSERVRGVQGDLADLPSLLAASSVDLVVCHSVLEVVEDPAAALGAIRTVLRSGGEVSVLAPGATAAVLSRAVAGRLADALAVLRDPHGRVDAAGLTALLTGAGFEVIAVRGVRVFTDLVPGALLDTDPAAARLLAELERQAATRPEFTPVAAQLHALGRRP
jgi:SAM-dependent methyltransferase